MRNGGAKAVVIMVVIFLVAGIGAGQDTKKGQPGRAEFQANCFPCHPAGGNVMKPEKPMQGSQKLANFKTFLAWIRNPVPPMTPFTTVRITDKQARDLYNYILTASKEGWK